MIASVCRHSLFLEGEHAEGCTDAAPKDLWLAPNII